ncbi:DUF839 domain-containing protein [Pseudomaricurvus alcaniphilus]|uniref:alkaline phosphatase PhoX n=1 Tax=Pseudomaricurvus alcaniphilus TaxID=1166482 RepID=UPI00140DBAB1|nr:alkaline phosphatase PhoX [Pseudomaricurvus alcaniphilus]NHN36997.1 DUF839 domain-containing protein [Pseudomaricurvus alcaniphilus]
MKLFPSAIGGLAVAISAVVNAGTEPFFNPLTQSSAVATPNHVNELNSPWQTPAGISQVNLTNMAEIEADINQSVVRAPGLGTGASMWDMVAFDPSGEFVFIPHETEHGAGVTRYSIAQDFAEVLFSGDNTGVRGEDGNWGSDWGAFDPATFTPYGTLLLGEEWSGEGRVMEVLNPYAAPENIRVKEKTSFANVSQEGIRFGKVHADTVYYVDEDRSGSIYKFVASDDNFDQGQTFVLMVSAFDGDASQNYNHESNVDQPRTGVARWVPLTNENGRPRTAQDPFENSGSSRPGRAAADELGATPFGRPEDVEVGVLANGNEVLYFTATSENTVYSVEMLNSKRAVVREFASEANTPKNLGFPATTGVINSPDNLAQDAFGNIYIIEDAPNGGDVGGDIWFVRDADNDGVAESVDHFMSIQVDGAEATGMIFNPAHPTRFVVSVQHPDSTDIEAVAGGQGDALWMFDLAEVIPPTCEGGDRYNKYSYDNNVGYIFTCSSTRDFNFTRQLDNSAE